MDLQSEAARKVIDMAITINIYYKGQNGSARKFVEEMILNGTVEQIRSKNGNLRIPVCEGKGYEIICLVVTNNLHIS